MHVNIVGCGIFAHRLGLVGRHLRHHRQGGAARAEEAAATTSRHVARLACGAGTLGILLPPSIIMIVYAVAAEVSIIKMFLAGCCPGFVLIGLFSGYITSGRCSIRPRRRRAVECMSLRRALRRART